ncbi:MAG: branched-chain amino acid ABC transporter substrate-binding protein [Acidimicrobiales bacterium]
MKLRWNKTVALAAVGAMAVTAVPLLAGTATSSAASKPTYTIGVQGPFTGSDSDYGLYEYAGVEYAVSLANASGKYDFKLKTEKFDDQGSSTVAPGAAQRAVGTKGLVAIVGPSFSGASQVSYQYYHAAHIAEVSPSATAVALASGSDSSFFRTVADDSVQGGADASYLVTTKGEKNVTVIGDESFYGTGLANVVAAQATKLGATVTTKSIANINEGGGGNAGAYSTLATELAQADPASIFYGGYAPEFGLLLGDLASDGYSTTNHVIMSGDGSNDSALMTSTSPATAANGAFLSESATGKVSYFTGKMATAFTKLTHVKASVAIYAAQSYDAANAIIKALVADKKTASISTLRKETVASLHKVSFVGVTGPISFQGDGDLKVDKGEVQVSEVENGVITVLTNVG